MGSAQLPFDSRREKLQLSTGETAKFFHLSHLRKMRGREQAAAICYRLTETGAEFLLVQTRNGCWTFPKGKIESGLTHAQSAALEAFEEAGVHGRIEEAPFVRYYRRTQKESKSQIGEICVSAHLCEVLRQVQPQEARRNPSWVSPEKAKRRLQDHRNSNYAAELCRVVDLAMARIMKLREHQQLDRYARIPYISIAGLKRR